jgi:hypothetical protein
MIVRDHDTNHVGMDVAASPRRRCRRNLKFHTLPPEIVNAQNFVWRGAA